MSEISVREDSGAVFIKVAARPGTRDAVLGAHGDALKLGVSAAPDKGKANKALAELLAEVLGTKKSAVSLVSGETSREKVFRIEGIGAATARAALARHLS
ncbi:MAG TPA: DUF167 domain-containing protein [Planctomycetota bacterium]|nr:DUF167 domain-containing protein [Planctomycetota bacterium]